MQDVLIVVPARVSSTRLPEKVLKKIGEKSLIVRVYEQALKTGIGKVVVACDDDRIKAEIEQVGGTAILTDSNLPSGTDRVYEAWKKFDSQKKYQYIINVQGDLPFLDPDFIREVALMLQNDRYDISTLASLINDDSYLLSSTVKPVISFTAKNEGRALYFSRATVPYNGPYYHHIGIYGFKTNSLEKFVKLPQSLLEKTEKLEQLRALENGMTVGIKVTDKNPPISIDTPEDLERARRFAERNRI